VSIAKGASANKVPNLGKLVSQDEGAPVLQARKGEPHLGDGTKNIEIDEKPGRPFGLCPDKGRLDPL
jgi:hypothetical protein